MRVVQMTWPLADQEIDQSVSEAMWSGHFRGPIRAGVFGQPGSTSLQVYSAQGPNREVIVSLGKGSIHGYAFDSSSDERFNLAANTAGVARYDLAVMRYDVSQPVASRIRLVMLQGAPGGGAPALTRNATVYDIRLATLTVAANAATVLSSQVADTREFSSAPLVPVTSPDQIGERVPYGAIVTTPYSTGEAGTRAWVMTPNGPRPIMEPPAFVDFNPRLIAEATGDVSIGSGGTRRGWWRNDNNIMDLQASFDFGDAPNAGTGNLSMPLPGGLVNAAPFWVYLETVLYVLATDQHYVGKFAISPGGGSGQFLVPRGDKPYETGGLTIYRQVSWMTQARNEAGTLGKGGGPPTAAPEIATGGVTSPRLYPFQKGTRLTVSGRVRVR